MPGTLALSFFYDDIDFTTVGLDRYTASVTQAEFPMYYLHYTVALADGIAIFTGLAGAYVSAGLTAYHYGAFYASLINYYVNRIDS